MCITHYTAFISYQDDSKEYDNNYNTNTTNYDNNNHCSVLSNTIDEYGNSNYIQQWLKHNMFSQSTSNILQGYNSHDILQLNRSDCIDLLGNKDGIRLYNRINNSKYRQYNSNAYTDSTDSNISSPDDSNRSKYKRKQFKSYGM